jgi:ankyrin repeat protein
MGTAASVKKQVYECSEADLQAALKEVPQESKVRLRNLLADVDGERKADDKQDETKNNAEIEPLTKENSLARLYASAETGNLSEIKDAIKAGAAINGAFVVASGTTPLMRAAEAGKHEVVALLKELGADLEVKDHNGWTAFHFAAANGRIECVKKLHQLKANKSAMTNFKRNALDVVAHDLLFIRKAVNDEDPRLGVVQFLVQQGLEKTAQFHMYERAMNGDSEALRDALDDGAAVNLADMKSVTAVARAAQFGNDECLRILHEHGADLDLADEDGWAPIHYAAMGGSAACVKALAELGADLKKQTKYQRNALDIVEEGILDNTANKHDDKNVIKKQIKGQKEAAKVLSGKGVTTSCLWDLLKNARQGFADGLRKALENGAVLDQADVSGRTAFIMAANYGQDEILQTLKDLGANIGASDVRGWSAVHWASSAGKASTLKLLHEMGADVNAVTKLKRNAVDLCLEEMGHDMHDDEAEARAEVLEFFDKLKIEPSPQMRLWVYAKAGDTTQVTQALDDGADVNLKTLEGLTAADYASQNCHKDTLDLLVKRGATFEQCQLEGDL